MFPDDESEMVLETVLCSPFNHLTWLLAQECFIEFIELDYII